MAQREGRYGHGDQRRLGPQEQQHHSSQEQRRRDPEDEVAIGEVAQIRLAIDRGVFMISVAAELANMHPQTLRTYEARGLIAPKRSPKGTRLYSQRDVEKLRRIQEMTAELGLNLAGVERVLQLESEVQLMHQKIEELELAALASEARLAAELEAVRRSFKAELVPYERPGRPGREIMLASQMRRALLPLRAARSGGKAGRES